jgi:hypothetical protein
MIKIYWVTLFFRVQSHLDESAELHISLQDDLSLTVLAKSNHGISSKFAKIKIGCEEIVSRWV